MSLCLPYKEDIPMLQVIELAGCIVYGTHAYLTSMFGVRTQQQVLIFSAKSHYFTGAAEMFQQSGPYLWLKAENPVQSA